MQQKILDNPQTIPIMLMALMKRLESIEDKLEKKIAYLSTEDAVLAYQKHIREGISRRGRQFSEASIKNVSWLLEKFSEHFTEKNIAELTTDDCSEFLNTYWDSKEKSCLKQRQLQLKIFFGFCIQYLKKKGSPAFHNPCELLDPIACIQKEPKWISTETMRKFIDSAKKEYHWLAFSILITSGIRTNDLINLRKCDVAGRVLKMVAHGSYRPKSGKNVEFAVIPQFVSDRLEKYLSEKEDKEAILPITEAGLYKATTSHGKQLGIDVSNHDLRRWCASYWSRKEESGMVNFVLRHSATSLKDRYVASLTVNEAMEKQNIMEKELFGM